MKKAFISVYTLLVLFIISLTITYIYNQQKNSASYAKGLYEKKQAQYLAESIMNTFMEENSDQVAEIILDDYDKKSEEDENNEEDSKKTKKTTKSIGNKRYKYDNSTYTINISRVGHYYRKEIDGLYLIFLDNVSVGDSKADSEIYIKVFDKKDENDEEFDKNRLRIEIRHTY
ncbi:hypothetical protein [Anaerococcus sp. Marseille-Q7828]|uniref:hypothetical protein n=1 Tax=Anaerococcus sp. Marseille-Q7828 TaxID=3036300 RepID=UPI0024AE16AD|nr:hypothetical protein [Anaerococcus sp. Marseille-Q7828]